MFVSISHILIESLLLPSGIAVHVVAGFTQRLCVFGPMAILPGVGHMLSGHSQVNTGMNRDGD
jgi:hypothetical protein